MERVKNESLWATAFVYFSSGFGFVVTAIRDGQFTGESMFWSQQSVSTLVNPSFCTFFNLYIVWIYSFTKKEFIIKYFIFGLLIQVKAYATILVLCGLFVAGVYQLITNHQSLITKVFLGSLVLNLFLLGLIKNDSLSVFVWQPMWFLETMMSYSDRLDWTRFYSAMTTYKMGHIWFKGLLAYSTAFVIF